VLDPAPLAQEADLNWRVDELAGMARHFEPASLDQLEENGLIERTDRKFIVPIERLPGLLSQVVPAYRALEIRSARFCRYDTQYFDTPDYRFYHAHHAGQLPRLKLRIRAYVENGQRFLEVKRRLNTYRTSKARVLLPESEQREHALPRLRELASLAPAEVADLRESILVSYARLTLINHTGADRVTVDIGLVLSYEGCQARYPGLACIEVKQRRRGPSAMIDALRTQRLREGSVSKYCLGVCCLIENVKKNNFKEIVRRLNETGNRNGPSD
jgi:hypothetical protein